MTGETSLLFSRDAVTIDDFTYYATGQGTEHAQLGDIREFFDRTYEKCETVNITVQNGRITEAHICYHP